MTEGRDLAGSRPPARRESKRGALRLLALCSAVLGGGCGSRHIPPPPGARHVTQPLDAMPADLDLVVRLDLQRVKSALGTSAMTLLSEQAVRGVPGADGATDALLMAALAATDTLWLGLRPARNLRALDSVWVMSGHFSNFDPHRAQSTPPFQLPVDLGGNLRRYDRAHAPSRSAPSRIYLQGEDLVVSVSEAEIDSVERTFEQQRGAPALEPPAKGVLSAVARPRALPWALFTSSETVHRIAEHARRLELTADLTAAGVDAALALEFEDPPLAEQVRGALADVAEALRSGTGRLAKLATRLKITSAGRFVSLSLTLGADELSEIVNCRGASCAW